MRKRLCFESDVAVTVWPIKLHQTGLDSFTVTYGSQVKRQLTYNQAASELGSCLMHAMACEGKLDNRMKGERVMRTVQTMVYTFDELDAQAKEKARQWLRDCIGEYTQWADYVIEDAQEIAGILGIEIKQRPYRTVGGQTRHEPCIWWSLHVQGSGVAFEGRYSYNKGSVKRIKQHAPQDEELHRIAAGLQEAQNKVFYRATIDISSRDLWMTFDDVSADPCGNYDLPLPSEAFESIQSDLKDFAKWIYRRLNQEWDYAMSDEQIDESIRANEYEFTKEGKREHESHNYD